MRLRASRVCSPWGLRISTAPARIVPRWLGSFCRPVKWRGPAPNAASACARARSNCVRLRRKSPPDLLRASHRNKSNRIFMKPHFFTQLGLCALLATAQAQPQPAAPETVSNLKAAYRGEAQASSFYTECAQQAMREGYPRCGQTVPGGCVFRGHPPRQPSAGAAHLRCHAG